MVALLLRRATIAAVARSTGRYPPCNKVYHTEDEPTRTPRNSGIDTYRRVSGTVSIDCFDQYRACIEWASGTVTYRYVSGMYRKGQIGCVENGHVFTVFTRVSNGPNPACAESACIVMYRACPNWGAGIHRYRKVSPVSCIEYVSRGPRFTHFFKTCEIREIHARYQGKKMEEYRIIIPVKKRAIHYDTWYWGKTYPIFGGNPPLIQYKSTVILT